MHVCTCVLVQVCMHVCKCEDGMCASVRMACVQV